MVQTATEATPLSTAEILARMAKCARVMVGLLEKRVVVLSAEKVLLMNEHRWSFRRNHLELHQMEKGLTEGLRLLGENRPAGLQEAVIRATGMEALIECSVLGLEESRRFIQNLTALIEVLEEAPDSV